MAIMVNVADIPLKVKISLVAGMAPMVTELAPGESADFPDGYCRTVKGAGTERLLPILSRKYRHHEVPVLVPEDSAPEARARYLRVKAAAEASDKSDQATIRRLEAELAQLRAEARTPPPKPRAQVIEIEAEHEDLVEATTPKVAKSAKGKAPKKKSPKGSSKK